MKFKFMSIAAVVFLASCGGGETEQSGGPADAAAPAEKQEVKEELKSDEKKMVEVTLSSDDQMKYDKAEIMVPAGSRVKLTLVHTGTLPKAAMGHNFVLLNQGVDLADFASRAVEAGVDADHIPAGDEVIANTKLIGGGEKTSVEFDAPEAGIYDFICSFPGHFMMMKGKFIVE